MPEKIWKQEISMEIMDSKNNLIRKYSSLDSIIKIDEGNVPPYWIRPQQILSTKKGAHRFTWDMHYTLLNETAIYPLQPLIGTLRPSLHRPG